MIDQRLEPASRDRWVLRASRWAARGRILLYLALCSLAFMRPTAWLGSIPIVPTDAIAATAGLCWLVAVLCDRKWMRYDRFFVPLCLYFLAMAISAVFADRAFVTFIPKLVGEAYLVGTPVLVSGLLSAESHLRLAVRYWLVGAALLAGLALIILSAAIVDPSLAYLEIVQHHFGSLPLGQFIRYRFWYLNPNLLGAYLTTSFTIALLASEQSWINSKVAVALVAGICMTAIATFSAGIGGIILNGTIWYALKFRGTRPRRTVIAIIFGAVSSLAFIAAQIVTPIGYDSPLFAIRLPGTSVTLMPASRLQAWIGAAHTFAAHPLTGVWIGSDVAHVEFVEPSGTHLLLLDGHNVLLNLAAGCGILGLIAILGLLFAIWQRARPFQLNHAGHLGPAVATGLVVLNVLVYQGIGGGFEDSRFVWFMIGLLLVSSRFRERQIAGTGSGSPETTTAYAPSPHPDPTPR